MFGRLRLVSLPEGIHARCRCECGNFVVVQRCALTSGHTRSCGCLNKEQIAAVGHANKTHGKRQTRVYGIWTDMMTRCYNTKRPTYNNYGGRGIYVIDQWHKFENFFADMGDPPTAKHSIDRKDNNKGYSKENCRWATDHEQAANRRSTLWVTVTGEKMCLAEACRRQNVNKSAVYNYIFRKGVTPQNALDVVVSKKSLLTPPPKGL